MATLLRFLYNGYPERIRLYGIDCPEKRQAFGKKAKQFTSRMVFKKTVDIKPVTRDRYGRTIAWVYFDGKCLNEELLKAGFAWHYKIYSPDRKLADLELSARQNKVGLWNDPHAIAIDDVGVKRQSAKRSKGPADSVKPTKRKYAHNTVMGRGIERKKIFVNDADRSDFIDRLAAVAQDLAMDIYAWTLMPNHYLC